MAVLKERDYSFDAIRGFCMFLIPLQHFFEADAAHSYHSWEGFIYFTIDLFVMQAFFFLSGYFSKKPERGREIAVKALLWPLLMTFPFFMIIQFVLDIDLKFNILTPPFAMWFLLCLFYYRMFHKDYIKIKHLFGIVFLLSLVAGVIPSFSATLSLARAVNWMPYFLLGYYCTPEQMEKVRSLKWWQTSLLAIFLVVGVYFFMQYAPFSHYGAVQMSTSNKMAGISWWSNIVVHLAVFVVSIAFLVVLFNVFGNKKGYWSWIGQNTMPIYIFHIVIFHLICRNGLGFGLFTPPAYDTPLYLLYVLVLATIVTTVLATKPFVWLYDVLFGKSYDAFIYCFHKIAEPVGGAVEKALLAIWPLRVKAKESDE